MARKMKDSGIEWIGEIPEGWSKNKVIRLFDISGSGTTPKNITSDFPVVNWIQSGDITGSFMPTCKNVISANLLSQYSALKVYPAPFIIIAMYGASVGNASISLIDGCVNQACCVLSSPSCNLHYAFYVIKSAQSYLVRKAVGGGQPNISQETIKQLWLPLPPLSTQDIIVRNLDATCSKIDDLLSSVHASIEEYKKLKQAVITLAVTKGVRGEREMKDSGVEWIREIPVDWEISRIKYVSIFEPSCDFKKLTPETIITYSPMECIKNGTFERRTSLYGNLAHTLTPFQNGDIVMAKVTPCFENGNIAIMNELQSGYGLGSSELFVFRPQNINTRYLFYWLQNKLFVHQACATMTGTGGLKRISPSFVKNCNIHYPSAAEQAQIAAYLDAKCAEIDGLIAKKEQLVKELESYKKSLIYEVVTGKREV